MTASCRDALIGALADGELHSGATLAKRFARSRTAIWKQLRQLGDLGLEIESFPGRGYRLAEPLELLSGERIRAALPRGTAARIDALRVVSVTDSTNEQLRRQPAPPEPGLAVLLAEYQSAGRGRRGRQWLSPFGHGLCLSLARRFDRAPPGLGALSLVAGLAVRRALTMAGAAELTLKWPNDVLAGDAKLAGLLIDCAGEAAGSLSAVIGVGVNVIRSRQLATAVAAQDGLKPASLADAVGRDISRNHLAALLIGALDEAMHEYQAHGFAPLAAEWAAHDALSGRRISVCSGGAQIAGIARGIDADGALRLETAGAIRSIAAGDVTLRSSR